MDRERFHTSVEIAILVLLGLITLVREGPGSSVRMMFDVVREMVDVKCSPGIPSILYISPGQLYAYDPLQNTRIIKMHP